MNKTDKEMLDWLKDKTETFFQENKDESQKRIYKYTLVPYMNENLYMFAISKTEEFHCFIRISDFRFFGITIFDQQGKDLEQLFKAAIKFSDDRNKLFRKWRQESEATQNELKRQEEKYNWNDLEYIQSETRYLSKIKFTHPEFIPNYAEISEIEQFLEYADGIDYFSLTYARDYLLNLVVDTERHIIGAIGTFRNTFLFEDYSTSLESLLEDSKIKFNEHWKLISDASFEAIAKNNMMKNTSKKSVI